MQITLRTTCCNRCQKVCGHNTPQTLDSWINRARSLAYGRNSIHWRRRQSKGLTHKLKGWYKQISWRYLRLLKATHGCRLQWPGWLLSLAMRFKSSEWRCGWLSSMCTWSACLLGSDSPKSYALYRMFNAETCVMRSRVNYCRFWHKKDTRCPRNSYNMYRDRLLIWARQ